MVVAVEGRQGARRLWTPLTSAAAAKPSELQWLAVLACWCARTSLPQRACARCLPEEHVRLVVSAAVCLMRAPHVWYSLPQRACARCLLEEHGTLVESFSCLAHAGAPRLARPHFALQRACACCLLEDRV